MLLLDYARNEVGLAMRGFHVGRHVGMTSDVGKADRMRDAGAHVTDVSFPPPAGMTKINQWEISFMAGREYDRLTPAEVEADRANEPDDRERQERERYEAL